MKVVSIIVPNYKTCDLTKFCLRSLKKFTDLSRVEVLAVDNASGDDSTEYLRSLGWIRLLERPRHPGETAAAMHANSLDDVLKMVTTPLVLVMHTDTIVTDCGWLDFLLRQIGTGETIAGVGSWKLEHVAFFKRFLKGIEAVFQKIFSRKKEREQFLRSHCALYRTELLRKYTRGFYDGECAGASAHRMLEAAGFEMKFIDSTELGKYIRHLNHATMILNRDLPGQKKTGSPAARKRLARELEELHCKEILQDNSLD